MEDEGKRQRVNLSGSPLETLGSPTSVLLLLQTERRYNALADNGAPVTVSGVSPSTLYQLGNRLDTDTDATASENTKLPKTCTVTSMVKQQ